MANKTVNMDYVGLASYKLVSVNTSGAAYDLTPLVESITWSDALQQAAQKIEAKIRPYPGLGDMVTEGHMLYLFGNSLEDGTQMEIARGVVWDRSRDGGYQGGMKLKAYDSLIYLLNNQDDFAFSNISASNIIYQVAASFGIPVGHLDDTGYLIPKLILKNVSLYDLFVKALILTREATGRKFFLRSTNGYLTVTEKSPAKELWVLEEGVNLLTATYTESLDEMRNRIKIVGPTKGDEIHPVLEILDDPVNQGLYGVLQEIRTHNETAPDKASAHVLAQRLWKKLNKVKRTANIKALAINNIRAGDQVFVLESTTGMKGAFYVEDCQTTVQGTTFADTVFTLRWDDDYKDNYPQEDNP